MKKQLIYQVYLGKKSNLYNFCIDSAKDYCKLHGIDHIVQTEPILKILPNMERTGRNKNGLMKELGYLPIFEKENAFSYLEKYDQIAIIDADIYIRKNAPNIFDDLTDDFDFGGVPERNMPITQGHKNKITGYSKDMFRGLNDVDWNWKDNIADFMNMGVMVFNKSLSKYLNGQTPDQFIRRKEFTNFVDGIGLYRYSTDQVLLNYWLKKDKVRVKHIDWKWNTMYRAVHDNRLAEGHFIHFFLKDHIGQGKGEDINAIRKILGV